MSLRPLLLVVLLAAAPATLAQTPASRAVHDELVVLDSHFDTPAKLALQGWSILDRHEVRLDGSQVDYPRMVEGGVDGGVFAVFTAQGPRTPEGREAARDAALQRIVDIREMVARHDQRFELALTAEQAEAVANTPERFVMISLENGYPLGRDLSLMRTFYDLGARMMGLVHTTNNELADSATDRPEWGGLSPLGRQFIAEANRLGVIIDASHASDAATEQMIELSRAPIILSHTGAKAVFDHPRNIGDDLMRRLAAKGGVIQINAFSSYMVPTPDIPERRAALAELRRRYGDGPTTQNEQIAYTQARSAIDARWPVRRATLDDLMAHILHAIEVVGIDHVGLSGDFDGGGGVEGMDDVTAFPKITERLLQAGYSKEDVAKFWGGNALRVMRQAHALRAAPAS